MRKGISSRLIMIVMLLALGCVTTLHSARAHQTTNCGPADAAAASMRAELVSFFSLAIYEPVRTARNLPAVSADSVVQVFDDTLCASAATVVAQKGGYTVPSVVYLFRAQNTYALFELARPDTTDYVHYLSSSMQYISSGVR